VSGDIKRLEQDKWAPHSNQVNRTEMERHKPFIICAQVPFPRGIYIHSEETGHPLRAWSLTGGNAGDDAIEQAAEPRRERALAHWRWSMKRVSLSAPPRYRAVESRSRKDCTHPQDADQYRRSGTGSGSNVPVREHSGSPRYRACRIKCSQGPQSRGCPR